MNIFMQIIQNKYAMVPFLTWLAIQIFKVICDLHGTALDIVKR